jgi:hypothetical protein
MNQGEQGTAGRIARDEVGFFFGGASAAMGLHGQSMPSDGGAGEGWDQARLRRAHAKRISVDHRSTVDKVERIRSIVAKLTPWHRRDLSLVYTPFGWGRFDTPVEDHRRDNPVMEIYTRFVVAGVQLLPLVLDTREIREAIVRAHPERKYEGYQGWPSFDDLVRYVESQIADIARVTRIGAKKVVQPTHALAPAIKAAVAREREAIEAYEEIRIALRMQARRKNVALYEKSRLAREEKDRARFEKRYGIRLEKVS